ALSSPCSRTGGGRGGGNVDRVGGDRVGIGGSPREGAEVGIAGAEAADRAVVGRAPAHPVGEIRIPEFAVAVAAVLEVGTKPVLTPVPGAIAPTAVLVGHGPWTGEDPGSQGQGKRLRGESTAAPHQRNHGCLPVNEIVSYHGQHQSKLMLQRVAGG